MPRFNTQPRFHLDPDRVAVLMIDVQPYFLENMSGDPDPLVCRLEQLLQTVLGLLQRDFEVFALEDCVFSSEPNTGPALDRMYTCGAIPSTYKIFYHEMTKIVGRGPTVADQFHATHPEFPPLLNPEDLPPWQNKR